MVSLKHVSDSRRGPERIRLPGQGRKKADGSNPVALVEDREFVNRNGKLPKGFYDPPPTEEERAAFLKKHGCERPDGQLNPDEVYEELHRPILPFDLEHARDCCDKIAEGYDEVWMKRHWPRWPGNRSWRSWTCEDEVKAYLRQCREYLSDQKMGTAERELTATFAEVKSGVIPEKLAMAVMNGSRFVAEHSQKFAEKRSPERHGQQLNVAQTVGGAVMVGFGEAGAALLEAVRATKRISGQVIEGELAG